VEILIPADALVVLVGISGSGKSTFAARHFRETEVLSTDRFRAMVADDEADQRASGAAFAVLHLVVAKRLARRRLTVVDATNLNHRARRALIGLAAKFRRPCVAIVLDVPLDVAQGRNRERTGRVVAPQVLVEQRRHLDQAMTAMRGEPYSGVYVLRRPADIDQAVVRRVSARAGETARA
jgi:protein phosphatase